MAYKGQQQVYEIFYNVIENQYLINSYIFIHNCAHDSQYEDLVEAIIKLLKKDKAKLNTAQTNPSNKNKCTQTQRYQFAHYQMTFAAG